MRMKKLLAICGLLFVMALSVSISSSTGPPGSDNTINFTKQTNNQGMAQVIATDYSFEMTRVETQFLLISKLEIPADNIKNAELNYLMEGKLICLILKKPFNSYESSFNIIEAIQNTSMGNRFTTDVEKSNLTYSTINSKAGEIIIEDRLRPVSGGELTYLT